MPRFAANLSMMYPEFGFLERFGAAARDGFRAVECMFPYAYRKEDIAALLRAQGLQLVLFNAPPGDWDAGERGLASLPGKQDAFQESIFLALDYAQALGCPRIHVMAGVLPSGADRAAHLATYCNNLRWAAEQAAKIDRQVLIEAINLRDMPGYFLHLQAQAHQILTQVGMPNLKVQMDLYHCQIMEGDLAMKIRQYLPTGHVAHLQIASIPARQEPVSGEVHYPYLFNLIDSLQYTGWIGCEYRPADTLPGGTTAGLAWWRALKT